jgi:hypothetical protein
MTARRYAAILGAAGLLAAAAGAAHAADVAPKTDFAIHPDQVASPAAAPKTLKFDARRGRWGVTLDLQQPDSRERNWNDIQAGAYYRITPSLRVGGAVAFGDQQPQVGPKKLTPDEGQPRVRLETQFKF